MRKRRGPRGPELPVPKRPYRDSILFYGVLSILLVIVAYLTDGRLARAVVLAVGFFVVATAWSWWRFRTRLEAEQENR